MIINIELFTLFTGTALHIRDAVPISAAVATRSRAPCRSMEDRRRKSIILYFTNQMFYFNQNCHSDFYRFLVCCLQLFYTNYQLDRHSVAIFLGS